MSTRGMIARLGVQPGTIVGRYHHFDSYPDGLGRALWNAYHDYFHKNLWAMMKFLIDDHPAGWSTIVESDFNLAPGYYDKDQPVKIFGPLCYCHGHSHSLDRSIAPLQLEDMQNLDYAYVLDNQVMVILDYGNVIAEIDLNSNEPNWRKYIQ